MDQCEYATDIVFGKQADLQAVYEDLARTAIHTIKPDNSDTFLGRKRSTQVEGEMGNRFNIRIGGTRIKHTMGAGVDQALRQAQSLPLEIGRSLWSIALYRRPASLS